MYSASTNSVRSLDGDVGSLQIKWRKKWHMSLIIRPGISRSIQSHPTPSYPILSHPVLSVLRATILYLGWIALYELCTCTAMCALCMRRAAWDWCRTIGGKRWQAGVSVTWTR